MNRTDSTTNNFENHFTESESNLKGLDGQKLHHRKQKGIRKMHLAALSALLIALTTGLISGYSAPAVYDMKNRPNSAVHPSDNDAEWIVSSVALGLIVGSLAAGPLADKFGRKDALIYNLLPVGFGWLSIVYANDIKPIIFGRLLCGWGCGIMCVVVPMYCVEIATAEVRGILGSAFQGFLTIGNLLSVTLGAFVPWKFLALHAVVFSIAAVMFFCLAPETPRWYLMKNDLKSAIYTMNKLQNGFVDAEKECEAIHNDLKNEPKGRVTWGELKRPTSVKPGLITLAIMFFHQFSGINAVFLNSSDIFKSSTSGDSLDPKISTIIIAVVQVVATLISNFIVDKAGRKILLIISGGLMGISFTIFGVYFYEASIDVSIEGKYGWIPITCVIVAVIGYSVGYGPLPYLLSAELLPIRVRGTISAIVHVADGIFGFILLYTFNSLENLLNKHGAFWFYSSMSAIGIVFVIFFVPETKGKRLEEIEEIFDKKRPRKQNINISVLSCK